MLHMLLLRIIATRPAAVVPDDVFIDVLLEGRSNEAAETSVLTLSKLRTL